jgi:hypothetical protein
MIKPKLKKSLGKILIVKSILVLSTGKYLKFQLGPHSNVGLISPQGNKH